jgi:signal transduction histidine kinase
VQPLADQIDAALEDRERAANRAGARAADLAHGLKTPLQALAGDADRLLSLGQPEIARDIEGAVRLMQRHVDREMARARLDAARPDATCAPAQVADRLVRLLNRAPPGDRLDWYVSIPPDLRLGIDADDLSEALGNLLENAARHARSRVVLRALIHGDDDAAIEVADDGPGIAEAMLHRVTARGTRLDHRGPGAGLGLAIVQDIAEAWSGSLTLRNGPTPDADSARAPGLVARINLKRSARMPRAGGATA